TIRIFICKRRFSWWESFARPLWIVTVTKESGSEKPVISVVQVGSSEVGDAAVQIINGAKFSGEVAPECEKGIIGVPQKSGSRGVEAGFSATSVHSSEIDTYPQ
ncbi:hypothetical protein, partial [uncultured Marinobacter sp.]